MRELPRARSAEQSGFVRVLGHRLYYRSFGAARRGVVLGLHGGPGASHDYLTPLADLRGYGYRVVLFDLLGCGRSDLPDDHRLFTLEHNVEEVEGVCRALRLGKVHLLGSSYGGLLALASALEHPDRLRSLITVGGLASVPFAVREMQRLKRHLPVEVQRTMRRREARGEFQAPDYLAAVERYYRRFLCRLTPWPADLMRSLELLSARPVYAEMNGPNEFTITGTIRNVDLTPRLAEIRTPTLVLGGRFDEVTPRVAEQIRRGIPGARRVLFERSSHVPFWEERTRFRSVVAGFLRSVDRTPTARSRPRRGRTARASPSRRPKRFPARRR